ncbi:hypothetical protein ACFXDO_18980 [Streptomyces nigra]|uniref:hypothetical protein n=1 Tax=Streptomyces nigra TaxID=1827580 RepID=UPI003697D056
MTDHPAHDYDDQAVSNRLGQHQHTLGDSLDSVLDIEAGLREILIHSRHDNAVDALGTVLNSEAGLADILPPTPQPWASDTSGTHGFPHAGDALLALRPAGRMALRGHREVKAAQLRLSRDLDFNCDPDRARAYYRARARDLALELARALVRDLNRALDLAPALDLALARDLDRARAFARALARALASDLARVLVLARDLDRALDRALDLALDLDGDLGGDLTRARTRGHDLTLALGGDLDRDAFIEIRTNELCRAIGLALHREPPVLHTGSVLTLLNDFTHDDLRDADLRGIDFGGVRWSQRTQWPSIVDIEGLKARSDETPPGSGIWIVRSGTTTVHDFADLT